MAMRFLVVAFALGICWLQQQAVLPTPWLMSWTALAALGALLVCFVFAMRLRKRRAMWVLACLVAASGGIAYADWRAEIRLATSLEASLEGQDVLVSGYIADLPDRGERGTRFLFHAQQRPAGVPENLSLSWYADGKQPIPSLRAGDAWQLTVRLRRPHGNLNPHGFDFEAWMFERNVRAVGYVRSRDGVRRTKDLADGIAPAIQRMRQIVRERFERALPHERWVGVLSALAVGDQSAVSASQWRLFSQTGVTHLMRICGSTKPS